MISTEHPDYLKDLIKDPYRQRNDDNSLAPYGVAILTYIAKTMGYGVKPTGRETIKDFEDIFTKEGNAREEIDNFIDRIGKSLQIP